MLLLPRRSLDFEASENRRGYDLQSSRPVTLKVIVELLLLSCRAAVSGVPQEHKQQQLNSHCDNVLLIAAHSDTIASLNITIKLQETILRNVCAL